MGVDVDAHQSVTIGAHPDVATAVATHGVDSVVHGDTRQTQFIADVRVPHLGLLVIEEQRALTIEPQVVHLVGKHTQRLCLSQFLLCQVNIGPHHMLLWHHLAAHHSAIVIDQDGSVLTFAYRTDVALGNTVGVVGIAKLIVQLLLCVIADGTSSRDISPHILVTVHIDNSGYVFHAYLRECQSHVALKTLCLRVIDAVVGRCLYP